MCDQRLDLFQINVGVSISLVDIGAENVVNIKAIVREQAIQVVLIIFAVVPAVWAIAGIRVVDIFAADKLADIIKARDVRRRDDQRTSGLEYSSNLDERVNGVGQQMFYDLAEEDDIQRLILVGESILFYIELLVRIIYDLTRLSDGHVLRGLRFRVAEEICQMQAGVSELMEQRRREVRVCAKLKHVKPV